VEVLREEPRDSSRLVEIRVRSLRGASTVTLILPPDRVESVGIGGSTFSRPNTRTGVSGRGYTAYAVPPEGIGITIAITGASPIDAYVIDRSSGLPPAGHVLLQARPPEATASAAGDVTIVYRRVQL
jgi:hypothetical protein